MKLSSPIIFSLIASAVGWRQGIRHLSKQIKSHKSKTKPRSIQFDASSCKYGRNKFVCAGAKVYIDGVYATILGHYDVTAKHHK